MTFNAITDLRRLASDVRGRDYTTLSHARLLTSAARDISRRGLAVQQQVVVDLEVGVSSYALPSDWIQTFAILHEDLQSYLVLKDQEHGTWYLFMDQETNETVLSNVQPAGINLAPGQSFYWLAWQSPGGTTYYTYPALLENNEPELSITDTQPLVGTGTTATMELRTSRRLRWFLGVSNLPEHGFEPFSSTVATLRAAPTDARALTLRRAEAGDRLDPDLPPGIPRYATTWQGRLWIAPVPDARYQLDHKYFALAPTTPNTYTLPSAFERLPVFNAFSAILRTGGRMSQSQSVQGIYEHLLRQLTTIYLPVETDSRDEYQFQR